MQIEDLSPDEDETVEDLIEETPDEEETVEAAADDSEDDSDVEGDGEDGEDEGDEEEPTLVTIEIDGEEYEVPEKLQSAFMKSKDYTTKTQAIAEQAKAIKAREEAFEAERQRDEEDLKVEAELFQVNQQLENYKNVDWDRARNEDFDNASAHFQQFQLLRMKQDELAKAKQQRTVERSQKAQEGLSKRIEEAEQYAVQNIPQWSDGMAEKLFQFAEEIGYDKDSFGSNLSPAFLNLLHGAYSANLIKQRANQPKPKAKAKVTPLKKVNAKSGTTSRIDLSTADMESYAKARMRGVGG